MDDKTANRLESFRTSLNCLDNVAHREIWYEKPPLLFTEQVEEIRAAVEELAETAGRQSAPTTGHAKDKAKEEDELEVAAHQLGRALALYGRKSQNQALGDKYNLHISDWRRMRDEALVQRVRLLESDAAAVVAADTATAAKYGITPAAIAKVKKEADDFAKLLVAPQDARADRSALTASLAPKAREIAALFEDLDDLLPQFSGTAAGDSFIASYQASRQVIDRGHGASEPAEADPAPAAPVVAG